MNTDTNSSLLISRQISLADECALGVRSLCALLNHELVFNFYTHIYPFADLMSVTSSSISQTLGANQTKIKLLRLIKTIIAPAIDPPFSL
jgi:hypothetical protein